MPPGQYLVFWGSENSFCGLKAISETQEEYRIARLNCNQESDQEQVLSGNALFLLMDIEGIQWLYHLSDEQVEEVFPSTRRDCKVYSVSWDGKRLAGVCGSPESGFQLAVRSLNSDWTILRALGRGIEESVNFPTWSPDGTLLAFSNSTFGESKGVYIIDANICMENPSACSTTLHGPYWKDSTNYIAWSPDGKQLVITLSHTIFTYDVASKRETRLVDFTKDEYWLHGAAWSPDGNWIGYARDKVPNRSVPMDLYLVPPLGGSPIFLTDQGVVQVVAWLKIEQ
jgi:Tol biopolymer transport system component